MKLFVRLSIVKAQDQVASQPTSDDLYQILCNDNLLPYEITFGGCTTVCLETRNGARDALLKEADLVGRSLNSYVWGM